MLNHIWIIMDWNRRWAREKGLPAIMWHKAWAENIENIVKIADEKWVNYITLWWLSTDNLVKRDENELKNIIEIIEKAPFYLRKMIKKGVKIDVIWNISLLPEHTQKSLLDLVEKTKNWNGITVILALVYGWKDEIIRWVKKFIQEGWDISNLDEKSFDNYLDSWKFPPADIIVRTWWDSRHSGFLLYSSAYSEYYFTDKKWPEFDKKEFENVFDFFNWSKRNFGK